MHRSAWRRQSWRILEILLEYIQLFLTTGVYCADARAKTWQPQMAPVLSRYHPAACSPEDA